MQEALQHSNKRCKGLKRASPYKKEGSFKKGRVDRLGASAEQPRPQKVKTKSTKYLSPSNSSHFLSDPEGQSDTHQDYDKSVPATFDGDTGRQLLSFDTPSGADHNIDYDCLALDSRMNLSIQHGAVAGCTFYNGKDDFTSSLQSPIMISSPQTHSKLNSLRMELCQLGIAQREHFVVNPSHLTMMSWIGGV